MQNPEMTRAEIGKLVGVTGNYVSIVLAEANVSNDPPTLAQKVTEYARANPNATQQEIADAMGTSRGYVSRVMHAEGITLDARRKSRIGNAPLADHIKKYVQANPSATKGEVVKLFNTSHGYLAHVLRGTGIVLPNYGKRKVQDLGRMKSTPKTRVRNSSPLARSIIKYAEENPGTKQAEIARALGCTGAHVWNVIKQERERKAKEIDE